MTFFQQLHKKHAEEEPYKQKTPGNSVCRPSRNKEKKHQKYIHHQEDVFLWKNTPKKHKISYSKPTDSLRSFDAWGFEALRRNNRRPPTDLHVFGEVKMTWRSQSQSWEVGTAIFWLNHVLLERCIVFSCVFQSTMVTMCFNKHFLFLFTICIDACWLVGCFRRIGCFPGAFGSLRSILDVSLGRRGIFHARFPKQP